MLVGLQTQLSGWIGAYYYKIVILTGINIILAVSLNLINGITGQFSIGHAGFYAVGAYTSASLVTYGESSIRGMVSVSSTHRPGHRAAAVPELLWRRLRRESPVWL